VEKPFDTKKLIRVIERELRRFDAFGSRTPAAARAAKRPRPEPNQILIIEDDEKIALALALRLKAAGYRATTTYDALTGVNSAVTNHPALVLMDISMPAGNGFSVAERIQALIPTRIPIIFVTASKKAEFRERAKKMGAAGYFEKPYEAKDLFGAIRRALA
jgi:DNA-binding response OmpR family regulator